MAIEDEMAAGVAAVEAADDIRHLGMGRDDAVGLGFLLQKTGDEAGGRARVAGGIGAAVLDESLQETHEIVAVAIDPIEQLLTPRVHVDLLGPMSIAAVRAGIVPRAPAPSRDRGASGGLFPCPRSPMLADAAISGILAKSQACGPAPAKGQEQAWEGTGVRLRP